MPDPTEDFRATLGEAFMDVSVEIERQAEPATDHLSIKDWLDRISGAGKQAFTMARAGEAMEEYKAWVEMAAIATVKAAEVLEVVKIEEARSDE